VTSISDFQELGYTQAALVNYMTLLGWSPPEGMGERFSLEEAARVFDFDRVNKAGARFDWDKLNWLNGQVLHELDPSELRQQLLPLWRAQDWAGAGPTADCDWQRDLCTLLGPSLTRLVDGVEQATAFFLNPSPDEQAQAQLAQPGAAAGLAAVLERLPAGELSAPGAQQILAEATTAAGIKKGLLMKSLRAALLGSLQGPDLAGSWLLLHRSGVDRPRLEEALAAAPSP
jgi:glutamyl-tRNA synthetase